MRRRIYPACLRSREAQRVLGEPRRSKPTWRLHVGVITHQSLLILVSALRLINRKSFNCTLTLMKPTGHHLSIRRAMGWCEEKVSADRIIFHLIFGSVSSSLNNSERLLRLKLFPPSRKVFFIFVAHKTRPLSAILSCLPSIFQKKWEKNQRKECKNWERAGMTSLICAWALQCASTGWLFMTWTSNPRRIQLPWWDVFLWGFRLCKSDLSITYCQKCAMLGEPQQPRMRILNRPVNVLHSVVDAPVDP